MKLEETSNGDLLHLYFLNMRQMLNTGGSNFSEQLPTHDFDLYLPTHDKDLYLPTHDYNLYLPTCVGSFISLAQTPDSRDHSLLVSFHVKVY